MISLSNGYLGGTAIFKKSPMLNWTTYQTYQSLAPWQIWIDYQLMAYLVIKAPGDQLYTLLVKCHAKVHFFAWQLMSLLRLAEMEIGSFCSSNAPQYLLRHDSDSNGIMMIHQWVEPGSLFSHIPTWISSKTAMARVLIRVTNSFPDSGAQVVAQSRWKVCLYRGCGT